MTDSELLLLLTVVNITQCTIYGMSAIGTVVQLNGYNEFPV